MRKFPKYPARPHATGLARIVLDGKSLYLGKHNSPESYRAYSEELSRWEARGGLPDGPVATVLDLIARFLAYADKHYRKPDGSSKTELHAFKAALVPLGRLFGKLPVAEFRPRDLRAYREAVAAGSWLTAEEKEERSNQNGRCRHWRWSRRHINRNCVRIRTMFRWAEAEELVPAGTFAKLQTLRGLERGAAGVRERPDEVPVPDEVLQATLKKLRPDLAAMVEVMYWTGARPSELLSVQLDQIDRSSTVWTAEVKEHKTAHHGHKRIIPFIPKAQEALAKLSGWPVRTAGGLRQAVIRACKRAKVTPWHPYQLRHNAATWMAKDYGPEVARIVLGHHSLDMTRRYFVDAVASAHNAIKDAG